MDIDRKKIASAINGKGIQLRCRECGQATNLDRDLALIAQWPPEAPQPSINKNMSVLAQLTCMSCGNVRLFNVGVLTQ